MKIHLPCFPHPLKLKYRQDRSAAYWGCEVNSTDRTIGFIEGWNKYVGERLAEKQCSNPYTKLKILKRLRENFQ